ncbi:MAG: peptidase S8, partial [Candidatus Roseilinea sp.]
MSSPLPALTQEQGTADLIAPNMPREGIPTNQIIIKYKDTAQINAANAPDAPARLQALSTVAGVFLSYHRPMSGDAHVLRLPERLPVKDVQEISSRLSALADVEYAEPDYIMQPVLTPNDPEYSSQWHYYGTYGINLPLAWDITTGSASVVVAVIDTGHRPHIDLSGRFIGGYDFISNVQVANDGNGRDNDPKDPGDWITEAESASGHFARCPVTNSSWHGTH